MLGNTTYWYKTRACSSAGCSTYSEPGSGYASIWVLTDVSLNRAYQDLALDCLPTLAHETGTLYFPVSAIFDSDTDPTNNKEHYFEWNVEDWRWVYIHVVTDEAHTYIECWYYYVHNPWLNVHEQDWELAIVVLDNAYAPVRVRMGYHGTMFDHSWSNVDLDGTTCHSFCYVHEGSHAMWNKPSSTLLLPPQHWSGTAEYSTWEGFRSDGFMFLSRETSWYYNDKGQKVSRMLSTDCRFNQGTTSLPKHYEAYDAPWLRPIWDNPESNNY